MPRPKNVTRSNITALADGAGGSVRGGLVKLELQNEMNSNWWKRKPVALKPRLKTKRCPSRRERSWEVWGFSSWFEMTWVRGVYWKCSWSLPIRVRSRDCICVRKRSRGVPRRLPSHTHTHNQPTTASDTSSLPYHVGTPHE